MKNIVQSTIFIICIYLSFNYIYIFLEIINIKLLLISNMRYIQHLVQKTLWSVTMVLPKSVTVTWLELLMGEKMLVAEMVSHCRINSCLLSVWQRVHWSRRAKQLLHCRPPCCSAQNWWTAVVLLLLLLFWYMLFL